MNTSMRDDFPHGQPSLRNAPRNYYPEVPSFRQLSPTRLLIVNSPNAMSISTYRSGRLVDRSQPALAAPL